MDYSFKWQSTFTPSSGPWRRANAPPFSSEIAHPLSFALSLASSHIVASSKMQPAPSSSSPKMVASLACSSRWLGAPLPNRRKATSYAWAIRKKNELKREKSMAIYITQGRYTSDAVKGMVANPENREKAVADLMEKAGAKLLAVYFTFGEYDFLSITEAPSEEVMASALIAGAASGGISHLRTSVAMTSKDAMKAFKSAGALSKSFKPPGR